MTRSLNIPRTDKIVWKNVMEVMSNSNLLKKRVQDRFGGKENYENDLLKEKKNQRRLVKRLQKIEETLSQIETGHLLEDLDETTFRQVRKNLDEEKTKIKDQLDQSRLRAKEMGNREKWLDSLSRFHAKLDMMETESEEDKKRFLELFVERIDVRYDHDTKEHELTIKFKLPIVGDGEFSEGRLEKEITLPPIKTTPQSRFSPGSGAGPRPCP